MKTAKKITFYLSLILGTLLIVATILSLLYNLQFWYLKILDFPREEILIGLLLCLVLFVPVNKDWKFPSIAFMAGLVASVIIQATFILPYTPLAAKEIKSAAPASVSEEATFSLLLANVWMKNEQADSLLRIIDRADPDMVLAMETNQWWADQLSPLRKKYAHVVSYPLDNTYGMILYSRLPLEQTDIKFLNHKTVPSIHTHVKLPNGKQFILHAMHPVPPKPSKYPDNVGEKEVALVKVGKMVVRQDMPAIVAGDLNDVAWSRTSRLFGTESKLGDVRVGRGLYNSFGAQNIFMRWPLDHVYTSEAFRVLEVERLSKFGSDHFPVYVKLALPE